MSKLEKFLPSLRQESLTSDSVKQEEGIQPLPSKRNSGGQHSDGLLGFLETL